MIVLRNEEGIEAKVVVKKPLDKLQDRDSLSFEERSKMLDMEDYHVMCERNFGSYEPPLRGFYEG